MREEGKGEVLKLARALNDRMMKHSQVQPLSFIVLFIVPGTHIIHYEWQCALLTLLICFIEKGLGFVSRPISAFCCHMHVTFESWGTRLAYAVFYSLSIQESNLEHLALPLQFLEDFVQPKKSSSMGGSDSGAAKAATVLDVCSGRTDHINLKQVVSVYFACQVSFLFFFNFTVIMVTLFNRLPDS